MGLGDLYHRDQRYRDALVPWERLLELDPTLLNILTMVGHMHRKQLDFEQAAQCFARALAMAPHNPSAVFGLADSLRGLGRFAEAAPHWEEILRADPRNQQVLTRAGDCYFRLGQLDRAEALFSQSLDIGHDKPALLGLARIHQQRGDFPEAVRSYDRILARNPGDARTILLLAKTLERWQGPAAATAYLDQQRKAHPEGLESNI
jgi:tetratricopeptide (TPR) repeat protein